MSVRNKAKDRDASGRIRRKYTAKVSNPFPNGTPSWWTNIYMNRPKRRENKHLCRKIVTGSVTEETVFPVGNGKPHTYYW
jgi:hypothetical protein